MSGTHYKTIEDDLKSPQQMTVKKQNGSVMDIWWWCVICFSMFLLSGREVGPDILLLQYYEQLSTLVLGLRNPRQHVSRSVGLCTWWCLDSGMYTCTTLETGIVTFCKPKWDAQYGYTCTWKYLILCFTCICRLTHRDHFTVISLSFLSISVSVSLFYQPHFSVVACLSS